ncbi:lipase family protein [Limnoraphis robusta]|uniref:lipase family protein n=1 Tax=Limnoraphis robusta TaxID=1118279 RepID=UPI002B1EB542|nr:lipase family protein [Limnoraphis robusta]MEA5500909.1 lipase family protein [Limnoraphis robusta BA-68 BA1]
MIRLTRRQLLLNILLAGTSATAVHEFLRLRALGEQQSILTELFLRSPDYIEQSLTSALDADGKMTAKVEEINNSLNLNPPTVPYNRSISKQLIQCSRVSTEQYIFGKYKPGYDGSIQMLPNYTERLKSYTQVTSILGPERAEISEDIEVPNSINTLIPFNDPLEEKLDVVERIIKRTAGQVISIQWKIPVYWGFVLSSDRANLIVFRGTQQTNEWMQNLMVSQTESTNDQYPFQFMGNIHEGFANLYSSIAESVIAAVRELNPKVPLYFSGHSLGGALATLASMDVAIRLPQLKNQIRLYTYASPRVGDPIFAEAHSQLIPNSYRIVNLGDSFTLLPLTNTKKLVYVHVGQKWSFLTQNEDFGLNHFVSTYQQAIEREIERNQDRRYPISAID